MTGFEGDSLDLSLEYGSEPLDPLGYEVRVLEGYVSVYPPDGDEPNNFCHQATPLPASYQGTLSLDTKNDQDWFRFTVPQDSALFTAALSCVSCQRQLAQISLFRDASVGTPLTPGELPKLGEDLLFDDEANLSARLGAGSYFLVVSNAVFGPVRSLLLTSTLLPLN